MEAAPPEMTNQTVRGGGAAGRGETGEVSHTLSHTHTVP